MEVFNEYHSISLYTSHIWLFKVYFIFFLNRSKERKSVGSSNHMIDKSMQLDRGSQALLVWTFAMQKATYYDSAGLFGGYSYPKSDSYTYGSTHQGFSSASIENDYQNPICPIQTTSVRPPAHKNGDINGSCMRPSASQGNSQTESVSEQQQAAPLAASSPSPNSNSTQKKKSPSTTGSSTATPVITKQIFPWMKETRQNAKQKNTNCPAAGMCALLFSMERAHIWLWPIYFVYK